MACIALFAGTFLGNCSVPTPFPMELDGTKGRLTGTVEKVSETRLSTRFVVHADSWIPRDDSVARKADFNIICTYRGINPGLVRGATVTLNGKLQALDSVTDLPYATDFNRFLYIDGVVGRMGVYRHDDLSVSDATGSGFERFFGEANHEWLGAIARAGFDGPTTGFLLAVIGGEDIMISDSMEEQFRQTGLSHILAISGLHVSIILILITALLFPLKLFRRLRPLYYILAAAAILFYALLTGGAPSACRAAAMCCIVMGNLLLEVRSNPVQSLSLAVIILLCFKPLWLFLPGFQFSVCAVLAIIAFLPAVDKIPVKSEALKRIFGFVLLPVVAVAGTLALTIFYFHSVSLNFWLANMVAAVFVPVLIAVGFVASLFSLLGLYSGLLTASGDTLYDLMCRSVQLISNWFPDSRLPVFLDGWSIALIITACILLAVLANNPRARNLLVLGVPAVVLFWLVPIKSEALPDSELYVPRHYDSTDLIVVHNGKSYVWTTCSAHHEFVSLNENLRTRYSDFYKHRKTEFPVVLYDSAFNASDGFLSVSDDTQTASEFSIIGNILNLRGRKIIRVDNLHKLPSSGHFDIALVSERYRGKMEDIVRLVDADSIMLSPAINYLRMENFERQLDEMQVPYRNLRHRGLVWQFP